MYSMNAVNPQEVVSKLGKQQGGNSNNNLHIYPEQILFENVQIHQLYEMNLFIRNHSSEIKNVRIIPPLFESFRLVYDDKLNSIAPGLAIKVQVILCGSKLNSSQQLIDTLTVIGDNFKTKVSLLAYKPRSIIEVQAIKNIGTMAVGCQINFNIEVKNKGSIEGQIQYNSISNHNLSVKNNKLLVQPQKTKYLQCTFITHKTGEINEQIQFKNKTRCLIQGIAMEEEIYIIDDNGHRMIRKNMEELLIGQLYRIEFYLINKTSKQVQYTAQAYNKKSEEIDLKVDKKTGNFINKQCPQEYSNKLMKSSIKCGSNKGQLKPFSDLQNHLLIQYMPTEQQRQYFSKTIFAFDEEQSQIQCIQNSETLCINYSVGQQMIKIPINYTANLPSIKCSHSYFQFPNTPCRQEKNIQFTLKNLSQHSVEVKFQNINPFRVEGLNILAPKSTNNFEMIFYPYVKGCYKDIIVLRILDCFQVRLKVYGCCETTVFGHSNPLLNILHASGRLKGQNFLNNTCRNKLESENKNQFAKKNSLNETAKINLNKYSCTDLCVNHNNWSLLMPKKDQFIIRNKKKTTQNMLLSKRQKIKHSEELSLEELKKIKVEQIVINFDNVFIDSESEKCFTIYNGNQKSIMFQLDTKGSKTLFHRPCEPVRVNAFQKITISLIFKPSSLGHINIPFCYIFNVNHIFQATIIASVTLINLEISSKNLEFSFKKNDLQFEKTQTVDIFNKGNTPTKFMIKKPENKSFKVSLRSAEVKPKSTIKVAITYCPIDSKETQQQRIDTQKLSMKVVGGAENIISCVGTIDEPKVTVCESQIKLNCVFTSVEVKTKLMIQNHSKVPTIIQLFLIPFQLSQYVSFDTSVQQLLAEERKKLQLHIVCNEIKEIRGIIGIRIRGAQAIQLPFYANVTYPQIYCKKKVIDYGTIPALRCLKVEKLALLNASKTDIKLQLAESCPQDYTFEISALREENVEITYIDGDKSKRKDLNTITSPVLTDNEPNNDAFNKVIVLQSGIESNFMIKFTPKQAKRYQIQIPLKISGANRAIFPVPKTIVCTCTAPVVMITPQTVEFEQVVIHDLRSQLIRTIQVSNPHDSENEWKIQAMGSNATIKGVFRFLSISGILIANQKKHIRVLFQPTIQGFFEQKFNFFLGKHQDQPVQITLKGQAVFPVLQFDRNEVILPVVPTNVEARSTFLLENHGYDAVTICRWKIATHFESVLISLNFYEGKILTLATKSLKIEVCFKSQVAISLTTRIQLYDEFGNKYEMPVSVTAENSLLTCYSLIEEKNCYEIVYKTNQQPATIELQLLTKAYIQNAKIGSNPSFNISTQFIKKWLNYQIGLDIENYPNSILQSPIELLVRMVNRMAGKEVLKKNNYHVSDKLERIGDIYIFLNDIIRQLQSEGAFLNQIRPEFLMSFNGYLIYMKSIGKIIIEQTNFEILSIKSWVILFYQLAKLYVLPRITPKMLKKVVEYGVVPTSTIYSQSQTLVLCFLNAFSNDDHICSFTDRIKLLQILQKVLQNSMQIQLQKQVSNMKVSAAILGPQIFLSMMSKFLYEHLKEYGLAFYLESNDLEILQEKQICLFLVSIIINLQHLKKYQEIHFEAAVGDQITKIIELENTSQKEIKYWVKSCTMQQFIPQQTEVTLKSQQHTQLKIQYQCKTAKPIESKLFLIPCCLGDQYPIYGQPMVFKLTTSIVSKSLVKKFALKVCLYEVMSFHLKVELPIEMPQNTQFTVNINEKNNSKVIYPTFICLQSLNRVLQSNHDKLELKIVPLAMQNRKCEVSYSSNVYGEFIFEIEVQVDLPAPMKQINVKQLRANHIENFTVSIPKQNEALKNAVKYLSDHTPKKKKKNQNITSNSQSYQVSIKDSSYLSIAKSSERIQITKSQSKQQPKITFVAQFITPFKQYSTVFILKNDLAFDIRVYRLNTVVSLLPRVVKLQFSVEARKTLSQKLPTEIAPCIIKTNTTLNCFKLSNYTRQCTQNCEMVATFDPQWIVEGEATIWLENKKTLEQLIYKIELKSLPPLHINKVSVEGSQCFEKIVNIPLNFKFNDQMHIKSMLNRKCEITNANKIKPGKSSISMKIHPSNLEEQGVIYLYKADSQEYYSILVKIENTLPIILKELKLLEKINQVTQYQFDCIDCSAKDFKINYEPLKQLRCNIKDNYCQFIFEPIKQINEIRQFNFQSNEKQYKLKVYLQAQPYPIISIPQVITINLEPKIFYLNLINRTQINGKYQIKNQLNPQFEIMSTLVEIKSKQNIKVKIIFIPNYLYQREKIVLYFKSDTLPNYQYAISAYSQFITEEQQIEFQCSESQNTESIIEFTNNFIKKQVFEAYFDRQNDVFCLCHENIFDLESKKTKMIRVKALAQSDDQIKPIKLMVRCQSDKKIWVYNLKVTLIKNYTNYKNQDWKCNCRESIYKTIQLPQGFNLINISTREEVQKYLSFSIDELQPNQAKFKYSPMKPLHERCEIILHGLPYKLRITCQLQVEQANPDDIISIITSNINEVGKVSFKLTNIHKKSAKYKAYFMKNTRQLSVEPENGILQGYGKSGNSILVSFSSNISNKRVQDKLIVQTEEMYWTFIIKGKIMKKLCYESKL